MNYRHAFHAGSFADVLKHAVLCRILDYLRTKETPFRVIDTHAGAGLYDLTGPEASRGNEWQDGIGRLMAAELPQKAAALLAPYLDVIAANLRGDLRIKTLEIDGWTALSAYVPPPERRGLVLVDPPFEQDDDFYQLTNGLGVAHRKWATGIYALWYPIKGRPEPDTLAKSLQRLGVRKILRAELTVQPLSDPSRLNGSGMIVVNPPWTLEAELSTLLPVLAGVLGRDGKGGFRLDWLVGE